MPNFDATSIDVAKYLHSRTLMGEFRGREIWDRLREEVRGLPEHRALIIDTTHALFLDYDFSSNAFAPLFTDTDLRDQQRLVVFQIASSDVNAFFHGILKHLQVPVGKYSESRETFIAQGQFCKIMHSPDGPIEFVGDLNTRERAVLGAVNEQQRASLQELARAVGEPDEEVHDALRALAEKGAIIDVRLERHEYYSFNTFLSTD